MKTYLIIVLLSSTAYGQSVAERTACAWQFEDWERDVPRKCQEVPENCDVFKENSLRNLQQCREGWARGEKERIKMAEQNAAINAERQRKAVEQQKQDEELAARKVLEHPIVISAAVCFYEKRASGAQDTRVAQRFGDTLVIKDVKKGKIKKWNAGRAARLRAEAKRDSIKVLPCGDKNVKDALRCLTQGEGDCLNADDLVATIDHVNDDE